MKINPNYVSKLLALQIIIRAVQDLIHSPQQHWLGNNYPHFIDEETATQTSSVTCSGGSGHKQNPIPVCLASETLPSTIRP